MHLSKSVRIQISCTGVRASVDLTVHLWSASSTVVVSSIWYLSLTFKYDGLLWKTWVNLLLTLWLLWEVNGCWYIAAVCKLHLSHLGICLLLWGKILIKHLRLKCSCHCYRLLKYLLLLDALCQIRINSSRLHKRLMQLMVVLKAISLLMQQLRWAPRSRLLVHFDILSYLWWWRIRLYCCVWLLIERI